MGFYDPDTGKMVAGQRVSAGKSASGNEIANAVEEAVARCQNKKYGSALKELKRMFKTYPQLKRNAWAVGEHPCSPLVELYTKELFG